jgi:membrane protein
MDPNKRFDPRPSDANGGDRPLGELFRALSADASALVRQEAALARAELRKSMGALAGGAIRAAIGAAFGVVALLALAAAAVVGVGLLLEGRYALAALIIGALLLAAGGLLVALGIRSAKRRSVAPRETLATLRETGDWARGEVGSLRAALARPRATDGGDGDGRALPPPPPRRAGADASDAAGQSVRQSADRGRDDRHRPTSPKPKSGAGNGAPDGPPLSLPLWKRVWREFQDDDVSNQAAKVAYYFFLSLPPLLMAAFGLAGLFGDERTADWLTGQLRGNLPGEAAGLVTGFVDDVVRSEHPGLLSVGLLLALWSGSAVFAALEDTLNVAYDVTAKRGFVKKRMVTLGTLIAVGLLFTAGSAALLAGPALSRALGFGAFGDMVWSVAQWPLAFALVVGAFWVIYYVLPNRDQRRYKLVLLKASAIAASLWVLATLAFRLYVTRFGSYSATYGLLGAVIVLLLWMYYTSLVILLGGEIAAEMERGG